MPKYSGYAKAGAKKMGKTGMKSTAGNKTRASATKVASLDRLSSQRSPKMMPESSSVAKKVAGDYFRQDRSGKKRRRA